jgi:NADH-quinone oxidoreductase subunit H
MSDNSASPMDAVPSPNLPPGSRVSTSPTTFLATAIILATAAISLSAVAFGPSLQLVKNLNIGLLFVFGISFPGVLGLILGGWISMSPDTVLAALRSAAQFISYQIIAGISLLAGFLLAGTLNIRSIVEAQLHYSIWFIFLTPVAFLLYFAASIAATNREVFDHSGPEFLVPQTIYPPFYRRSLRYVADIANNFVIASVATTLFLGGWLRPFPNVPWLGFLDAAPVLLFAILAALFLRRAGKQSKTQYKLRVRVSAFVCFSLALFFAAVGIAGHLAGIFFFTQLKSLQPGLYGAFWFLVKVVIYQMLFSLVRSALPRYRFAQSMRTAWSIFLPLALVNLFAVAVALALESEQGWNRWLVLSLTTLPMLFLALYLLHWSDIRVRGAAMASFLAETDPYAG